MISSELPKSSSSTACAASLQYFRILKSWAELASAAAAAKEIAPSERHPHENHFGDRREPSSDELLRPAQRPPTASEGSTSTTNNDDSEDRSRRDTDDCHGQPISLEDRIFAVGSGGARGAARHPARANSPQNKTPPANVPIKEQPRACTSPTTAHPTSTTPSSGLSGTSPMIPLRPESAEVSSPAAATAATSGGRSSLNVRQLAKMKRFLVTLQQFSSDISPDIGDSVHQLIFALVGGSITVDEFQTRVQEATSYPLRPFVAPFLRANLPLMQAELMAAARAVKQSPQQYLRTNETFLLDPLCQAGEPFEIFHPEAKENTATAATIGVKRARCDLRSKEVSLGSKRVRLPTAYNSGYISQGTLRSFDAADQHEALSRDQPFQNFNSQVDLRCDTTMEDVLRNIYNMLNCIVGMVEKTKRTVCALQRGQTLLPNSTALAALGDVPLWSGEIASEKKRPRELFSDSYARTPVTMSFNNPAGELESRVSEVRKRAEEAVAEVKRHAVLELQRALAAAESRTSELLAAERAKVDCIQLLSAATPSTENCFNCGRRASETCSGCSWARYCGAFCQHKDWEQHHRVCGAAAAALRGANGQHSTTQQTGPVAPKAEREASPSPVSTPPDDRSNSIATPPAEELPNAASTAQQSKETC